MWILRKLSWANRIWLKEGINSSEITPCFHVLSVMGQIGKCLLLWLYIPRYKTWTWTAFHPHTSKEGRLGGSETMSGGTKSLRQLRVVGQASSCGCCCRRHWCHRLMKRFLRENLYFGQKVFLEGENSCSKLVCLWLLNALTINLGTGTC